MKSRQLVMVAASLAALFAFAGESFARGGGGGGGGGRGSMGGGMGAGQGAVNCNQSQTRSQTSAQSQTQVRPEGSQRRDGSFLTTGTTANGSTTRPSNGRGVMDGTGPNAPATTTAQ